MKDWKTFLADSPIAARVTLPTFVVLHRLTMSPTDVARATREGALEPADDAACMLEVGGQCVAQGRIVRRGGRSWFKVTRMAEGGES